MKARKTLTHVNLVKETIEQAKARFQPNIPMIKKCIEHLIEEEYLQRLEGCLLPLIVFEINLLNAYTRRDKQLFVCGLSRP